MGSLLSRFMTAQPEPRIDVVSIRLSPPHRQDDLGRSLIEQGLVPLIINERCTSATTEEHLREAFDTFAADPQDENPDFVASVVEAICDALESGLTETEALPDDALILFVAGLRRNGVTSLDDLDFCEVRFDRDDVLGATMTIEPLTH